MRILTDLIKYQLPDYLFRYLCRVISLVFSKFGLPAHTASLLPVAWLRVSAWKSPERAIFTGNGIDTAFAKEPRGVTAPRPGLPFADVWRELGESQARKAHRWRGAPSVPRRARLARVCVGGNHGLLSLPVSHASNLLVFFYTDGEAVA